MRKCCPANCILPPYMLKELLDNKDATIRKIALDTLLATTQMRSERRLRHYLGTAVAVAGTKRRTIFDCGTASRIGGAAIAREEGGKAVKDKSVNNAFDGLGRTYDFFKAIFGRNSLDNRGMRLDGYVHYGRWYNNAFWDGQQMVFGDGDGKLFTDFSGSLDVVAHELAHGVTEHMAGLEYHNQSGALNESMSDVFGSLVKQWVLKQDVTKADWLIGSEIFTPAIQGDALRSLKNPGSAYDDVVLGKDPQPKHFKQYRPLPDTEDGDWGGVHINSGIPNHAFYLAAMAIGGNAWEGAGRIWYEALKQSDPQTDFSAFAGKTAAVAADLYGKKSLQARAVQDGWKGVGVKMPAKVAA